MIAAAPMLAFDDPLDDILPLPRAKGRPPTAGEHPCFHCRAAAAFAEGPPLRPANDVRHYCRRCLPADFLPAERAST